MKLRIRQPESFTDDWSKVNKTLMKLLLLDFDIVEENESCGCRLGEILSDQQLKDVAVMVFKNDFPATVTLTRDLMIVGDGRCPACGAEDYEWIDPYPDGEYEDGEMSTYTAGGYNLCGNCGEKFN